MEPHIDGPPVASGIFTPNMHYLIEIGLVGIVGFALNWRREKRALESGLGLARRSLVVVTSATVYVFDAWLLGFKGVRLLLRHSRANLVARAFPLKKVPPAVWPREPSMWPAGLRLEDRSGQALAELAPEFWGDDTRGVLRALTGHEGWPRETQAH